MRKKLLVALSTCLFLSTMPTTTHAYTDPGTAFGTGFGYGLGQGLAISNSMHSDNQDDINKEYDFSNIKNIVVFSFCDTNTTMDTESSAVASVYFSSLLKQEIKKDCPNIIVFGPELQNTINQKYQQYVAEGGTLSALDFGTLYISNLSDIEVFIKTEMNGCDDEAAYCNMEITALDSKTGKNVFTRTEQRRHVHIAAKVHTVKECTFMTVKNYAKKIAKLIKKSRKSNDDE